MNKLRQEFEDEMKLKFKGVELLFETNAQKYINWLEAKIEALSQYDVISKR